MLRAAAICNCFSSGETPRTCNGGGKAVKQLHALAASLRLWKRAPARKQPHNKLRQSLRCLHAAAFEGSQSRRKAGHNALTVVDPGGGGGSRANGLRTVGRSEPKSRDHGVKYKQNVT